MVTNSDKTNDNHIFMSVKEVNSMKVGAWNLKVEFDILFCNWWSPCPLIDRYPVCDDLDGR